MFKDLGKYFKDNPRRKKEYQVFKQRYQENPNQFSNNEAVYLYYELMRFIQDEDEDVLVIQDIYGQVFGKLSKRECQTLEEYYREANFNDKSSYKGYVQCQDLEYFGSALALGCMTRVAAQQDLGLLEQLVGPNSPLSGTTGKTVLVELTFFIVDYLFELEP